MSEQCSSLYQPTAPGIRMIRPLSARNMSIKSDLDKEELSEWRTNFNGKTPADVLKILYIQQKQIERLIDQREALKRKLSVDAGKQTGV